MTGSHSAIVLAGVAKSFTAHLRDGHVRHVMRDVAFEVRFGECVVLGGASGAGKSSILKMIYGNYRCDAGSIRVADGEAIVDVATAEPRRLLKLRQTGIGYVSQFLRAIPRVSALDLVAEAARESGLDRDAATARGRELLARLNLPEALWGLAPATFSGGEQQRVNIARGFAARRPILLLDEPTASLDALNRAVVIELIREARADGAALLGIFHDADVRDAVADRIIDVTAFAPARSIAGCETNDAVASTADLSTKAA